MNDNSRALHSQYIISGTRMDVPPAVMLDAAQGKVSPPATEQLPDPVIDETIDPSPSSLETDDTRLSEYLTMVKERLISAVPRGISPEYSEPLTRAKAANALIDALWQKGHFKLDDLCLSAAWKWAPGQVGNMAAFYASVSALCDYLDCLGVGLDSYSFSGKEEVCTLKMKASLCSGQSLESEEEDSDADLDIPKDFTEGYPAPLIKDIPFKTANPHLGRKRICPSTLQGDPSSWIIYIPFDTCPPKMGGSVLSEVLDSNGGTAPDILDPDYLMDCYEVVRELVEDGIVLSGVSVCEGGLMTALDSLCSGKGADIDISEVMKSYGESYMARILFSEIPGVVIEVRDYDYDYVDAELLLQDVAYYFIGHPSKSAKGLRVSSSGMSSISGILESLLRSQTSEGED
ncbi:MAG: hypothetical protein IJL91_12110 [Bacteroidales bacterium]|nr:hypothetical protein [Bacteroidales bacterium]